MPNDESGEQTDRGCHCGSNTNDNANKSPCLTWGCAMVCSGNDRSGYFGGFMLYFATLISTTTGNIYGGLWYAVIIAVASTALGLWKLPETLGRDIRA